MGDDAMHEQLKRMLEEMGRPAVCVIGEVGLDTYVWGCVSGISPEGPIPVLRVSQTERRPGGAAVVAVMLGALGARPACVGAVGEDEAGRRLREQLEAGGIDAAGLVVFADRTTPMRVRYFGYVQAAGRGVQQMLRVEEATGTPLEAGQVDAIFDVARAAVSRADAVLVYNLPDGPAACDLIERVTRHAVARGKPLIVDPEMPSDGRAWRGASCLLVNRAEAGALTGLKLTGAHDWAAAARMLIDDGELQSVVIKLDRDGIYMATAGGESRHVPAHPRELADVTGAGDMVAAALGLGMAAGRPIEAAVDLANLAAGVEVTYHGARAVSRRELQAELLAAADPALRKIKPLSELLEISRERRARGEKMAFTNGCFDLLHLGHLNLIQFARRQGDYLVVGLNTDRGVKALKGPSRPVNNQEIRARILAGLEDVDYVVMFDTESVLPLIQQIKPDVLVKGGDYPKTGVVGWEFVEGYGGRVALAPQVKGLSTTEIIQRMSTGDEQQSGRKQ